MSAAASRSAADELLDRFHLTERSDAPVMALSGGMAQRLMVARAILHRPAILFLDEPTAGLDPQTRIGLWEILGELHANGQTVVLTTHNMEEADQLCDRIGIMDRGKLLALGTPDELKGSIGADTIVTVSADGDLGALARELESRVEGLDSVTTLDGSVHVAVRGTDRVLLRVIAAADDAGLRGARRAGRSADARDGLHQPHGQGAARLMTATATPEPMLAVRSAAASSRIAFGAMLLRDLVVLRKRLREFIPRTLVQPLLLCFVFLYVFPTIGSGVGGSRGAAGESAFATILVAGVVGLSIMFQGIQAVALPLVQEFGYTREIEDRVLAPLPVSLVALEKVDLRCAPGAARSGAGVPHRSRRACEQHPHPPPGALAGAADADAARLRHVLGAGPDLRHDLRSEVGSAALRDHHPAPDVPRRHVLRLDDARAGHHRRLPLAPDPGPGESADLHQRGVPRGADVVSPHDAVGGVPRADRILRALPLGRHAELQAAGRRVNAPRRPAPSRVDEIAGPCPSLPDTVR